MTAVTSSALGNLLAGRQCQIAKREFDWNFNFGEGLNVTASVPWRIVTPEGIALADADDGQWFGLPQPVNGEATANALLDGRRVVAVEANELTADLQITFDESVRLDLFNNSSGYEGWQADLLRDDAPPLTILAMGGGGFTIFSD